MKEDRLHLPTNAICMGRRQRRLRKAVQRHVMTHLTRDTHLGLLQVRDYKGHRIDPPSTTVTATKSELMGYFQMMYKMRRMEIAADMLYKSKLIRGFCHLCVPPASPSSC